MKPRPWELALERAATAAPRPVKRAYSFDYVHRFYRAARYMIEHPGWPKRYTGKGKMRDYWDDKVDEHSALILHNYFDRRVSHVFGLLLRKYGIYVEGENE